MREKSTENVIVMEQQWQQKKKSPPTKIIIDLFACLYLNEILFCEYFNYFDFSVCWLCILVRSEVMALNARQGKNETRSFEYATPYGYYLLLISLVRFCIIPAFYVFYLFFLCLPLPFSFFRPICTLFNVSLASYTNICNWFQTKN